MNRRLLVISFHAAPELAVGGLRWTGLSRSLARRGWEVRLITASPGAEDVDHPAGMHVSEVRRRSTLQDHYRRWRTRGALKQGLEGGTSGAANANASRRPDQSGRQVLRSVRSSLGDLMSFPDHGRGWLIRAARMTRLTANEWTPDAVISTGPPHSVHVATRIGLRGHQIPWLVDLRDPWVTPKHDLSQTGWSLALARRLESEVFRRASVILTTTPELREVLRGHFPAASLAWIPNGVDTLELPSRAAEQSQGLSITHLGSVYFNRDPTPVIRAFAKFLDANPAAASAGSMMRFVGDISPDFRRRLEETMTQLGITQHVQISGRIPRARALEILAGSRMALVLAQGQDTMVPAKLYEAVAMGLPTIVVTEASSATGRESSRLGATVHCPDDEAGMVTTMKNVWCADVNVERAIPSRIDHADLATELEEILFSLWAEPARRRPDRA